MTAFHDQLERIRNKLLLVTNADNTRLVFGSKSHNYLVCPCASASQVQSFEAQYALSLPACYRSFLLRVGNGGAGPFYGIHPLGTDVDDLVDNELERALVNECLIYPRMSDDYWKSLTSRLDSDNLSDSEYDREKGRIYGGILPIGSQGCTYLHAIVLNGPHKGRVVNLDLDLGKPKFAYENNFLDWYERWLDEILHGDLSSHTSATWFGYSMGGSEQDLLAKFRESSNDEEAEECLAGLLTKARLVPSTLDVIEEFLRKTSIYGPKLTQLIVKSDYARAKPYLTAQLPQNMLLVFQSIYWYARNTSAQWIEPINQCLDQINDDETFRFCTYILREAKVDYGDRIVSFTRHSQSNIRVTAFHALGLLGTKRLFIDDFIRGLSDESVDVLRIVLQALDGIVDPRLLPHYKRISQRFPTEEHYLLSNLNRRLADFGLNYTTILEQELSD